MYPSLNSPDFGQPSSSGRPQWPPPQLASAGGGQNGPSAAAAAPSNQPMLRVHIAEQYRTFPPVMINSALEDIQRTSFAHDFDFERQLIRKHEAALEASLSATLQRPDPLQQHVERFAPLGYTREDVSMALTALGGSDNITDDKVAEACKNCRELKSMGFGAAAVVGALVLHGDDLVAATDACLAGAADAGLGLRS